MNLFDNLPTIKERWNKSMGLSVSRPVLEVSFGFSLPDIQ